MRWTDEPGAAGGGRLFRRGVSVVLVVASALLAPLAITAHWSVRTVDDGARYEQALRPLATSPPVQRAVTDQVTDHLVSWVGRDRAPVSAAQRSVVHAQVAALVRSRSFPTVWEQAVARSHPLVVDTLHGRSGAVGPATIDLTPLVDPVVAAVHRQGVTVLDGLVAGGAPDPIGTGDRRVTLTAVARNDVSTAQGVFAALQVLAWALPAVVVIAALGALAAAVRRLRTLVALVLGIAAATGAALGVVAAAGVPVGKATGSAGDAVVAALLRDLRSELLMGFLVTAAVGVVLVAVDVLVEGTVRRRRAPRLP